MLLGLLLRLPMPLLLLQLLLPDHERGCVRWRHGPHRPAVHPLKLGFAQRQLHRVLPARSTDPQHHPLSEPVDQQIRPMNLWVLLPHHLVTSIIAMLPHLCEHQQLCACSKSYKGSATGLRSSK